MFSLPILPALKKKYPRCRITWVIDEDYQILLKSENLIDKLIVFPKKKLKKCIKERSFIKFCNLLFSTRAILRKEKYDLILDLQGLFRTNLLAYFCHSKNKISLGSEFLGRFFCNKVFKRDRSERISSEYFELSKTLGFHSNEFNPRFSLDKSVNINNVIPQEIDLNKSFVIIPFTTRPEKHWDHSSWEELTALLVRDFGYSCILLGHGLDSRQKILANNLTRYTAKSLIDKTSLMEASVIISKARFCIGVDTGLTHISVSLGQPTIAIFLSTCPYLNPVNKNIKIIWTANDFLNHRKDIASSNTHTCLKKITVSSVRTEVLSLVEN